MYNDEIVCRWHSQSRKRSREVVRVVQDAPSSIVIRLGGSIVQRERLGSLVHLIPGPHLENADLSTVEVRITLSRSAGL
jgi:hypothetical protein